IRGRFYMLHLLLITMDERDELLLPEGIGAVMQNSEPNDWLPFLSDDLIRDWRDFLAQQIDEHDSQTLRIFGGRIKTSADDVRALLDDEEYMTSKLWNHVSHETLAEVERDLYQFAREQLVVYWEETQQ
ncbi:MAG: hypothetical protein WBC91_14940, partial [Phototrophicaceae bacterium]